MLGNKAKFLSIFLMGAISCGLLSDEKITDKKAIDFVTFYDPPYIFDPSETSRQGLVQIILKNLMHNIGIQYSITLMPPKRAEIFAKATPNTCILPIEKSQEREVYFSWVSPILVSKHGLFQLQKHPQISLEALDDARPYRLGSYLGSAIGAYLKSFDFLVDFANQNEANIYKLSVERIDLWASDILTAAYISKTEDIKISDSRLDFFTTLKAIGCHPSVDAKIISEMNKELQWMYQTGQIYSIVQKFKADIY